MCPFVRVQYFKHTFCLLLFLLYVVKNYKVMCAHFCHFTISYILFTIISYVSGEKLESTMKKATKPKQMGSIKGSNQII